ncbi:MAG: response regulator [Leadbetterella sp.]
MVNVILIDDHQIILDSLQLLLTSIPDVNVLATFEDPKEAIDYVAKNDVDVVISDCNMPTLTGIDVTLQIRSLKPDVKILLLTMAEDGSMIRNAIKAGVNGYILKKTGKVELQNAIQKIVSGKKYYSEMVVDKLALAAEDLNDASPNFIEHLTSREIEILKLISAEKSTPEIAEALFISVSTVETHRAHLMKKLGVKSAIGMVKFALKHQLV